MLTLLSTILDLMSSTPEIRKRILKNNKYRVDMPLLSVIYRDRHHKPQKIWYCFWCTYGPRLLLLLQLDVQHPLISSDVFVGLVSNALHGRQVTSQARASVRSGSQRSGSHLAVADRVVLALPLLFVNQLLVDKLVKPF